MPKRGNGEGSIYPYKNKAGKVIGYRGSYWIHTAEGPKRRYISGKKREDVRDKLAKALSDRADGLVFEVGTMTVGEYLDRWLGDVRDTVRKSTHEGYEYAVRPHIKPALGRIKLKDLNPAQIRWFYRDRLDSGDGPQATRRLAQGPESRRGGWSHPSQRRGRPEAPQDHPRRDRPADGGVP